jgi:hypothetical protein
MKYPTPRYSFLAFQLNGLLDQGQSIPIDEAHDRIHDGSLIDWLADRYGGEPHYFDVSLYDAEERELILKVFESMSDAIDAKGKLGVAHNGIALCLAYCIEVMQHADVYEDDRFKE